jgi:exodeoxyribonuclease-1
MPFAFYDLETTGRSPAYDQPLQFAAILTDDGFKQIERVNLRCRLAPHILPSPGALAVTGVSIDQAIDPTLPSWFDMMREIQSIIQRWAPATWTGYNSISFDENFLRQSFYQTLQPEIFATQFFGNSRLDIMHVIFAVYVRAPDILVWPEDETGKVLFKLDRLAPSNGFENHAAHDALGDVEATIFILDLIRHRAPDLLEEILANRGKAHVNALLNSGEPMDFISRVGGRMPVAFTGCGCGFDAGSVNTAGFFDVHAEEPRSCFDLDDAGLIGLLDRSPRVIRKLKVNETPMLLRSIDPDPIAQERCQSIAENAEFRQRIGVAMASARLEKYPPPDPEVEVRIEERIYEGFYGQSDKQLLHTFNQATNWPARLSVIEQFEDERLKQLGLRAVALLAPEILPNSTVASAAQSILAKWQVEEVPRNGWTTLAAANSELGELLQSGRIDETQVADLRRFYEQRVGVLAAGQMP